VLETVIDLKIGAGFLRFERMEKQN